MYAVNACRSESKFICKTIELETQGQSQNVVMAPAGIDLEAVVMPEITGADPTLIPSSLLTDEAKMKEANLGVVTQVLTIGYLYGYSGQQANFPVAKFGHISITTEESWYLNPESKLMEQGYVLDLSNTPGIKRCACVRVRRRIRDESISLPRVASVPCGSCERPYVGAS